MSESACGAVHGGSQKSGVSRDPKNLARPEYISPIFPGPHELACQDITVGSSAQVRLLSIISSYETETLAPYDRISGCGEYPLRSTITYCAPASIPQVCFVPMGPPIIYVAGWTWSGVVPKPPLGSDLPDHPTRISGRRIREDEKYHSV